MIKRAAVAALAAILAAAPSFAADPAAPTHHEIRLRLDPETRRMEVTDLLTVQGRDVLVFRLAPWATIESLLLDGRPEEAKRSGEAWRVSLPDAEAHRLEFQLTGRVPALPTGSGRGPTPPAVAGAEGSYLSGYAGWFPVTRDDWTGYRLVVEVPPPYRAVATGSLEDESLGESENRAVFAADYPAEMPALFAGPYQVREQRENGIRMRTYFHRGVDELSPVYLDAAGRYLKRYGKEIGPYPFQDFHVVSSPLPVGLGFPNVAYVGRMVLSLPFMRGRSLAHEVLHNWWGSGVAPDYGAGNWSEGLTTYMADYALAAEESEAQAMEMRLGWLRNYAALPAERDMAVTDFTSKQHDAAQVVGYGKVAFIFHMLRAELGDTAFEDGLRRFWQQQRFRIAGWPELRQAFETASDRDLAWFFEQWLRRTGAPELRLGEVTVKRERGAFEVTLTIRQTPPAYRLRVPVVINTVAGPQRRIIEMDGERIEAGLDLEDQPMAVRVDPDYELFRRLLPGEAPPILRDVTLAADAATIIAADDNAVLRAAGQLAERMLDMPVRRPASDEHRALPSAPALIIGLEPKVEDFLAANDLGSIPESLDGRGTARVWTIRREGGNAMVVVAADDVAALEALIRPLPHYGGKSYLVFDGRRALEAGVWPAVDSPLSRRLDR